VFRTYNDGIAYRYRILGKGIGIITGEASSFNIPGNSRAWGQPVNEGNCHESQYESGIVGKDFLTDKHPWFPILFTSSTNDFWVLLTEAAVYGDYCASHVEYENGMYKVVLHDSSVTSSLPWETPWRVAVIGKTLAPIIEINLVENLNPPSVIRDMSWIRPGRTDYQATC
jgi:alpha-glucosidase